MKNSNHWNLNNYIMQTFQFNMQRAGGRLAIFGGINLLLIAVLVFVYPQILAYAVATLFGLGGLSLIGFGLRTIRAGKAGNDRVVYRKSTNYND